MLMRRIVLSPPVRLGYMAAGVNGCHIKMPGDAWVGYKITYVLGSTDANICVRYSDSSNRWRVRAQGGSLVIYEINAGTQTARTTVTSVFTASGVYDMRVQCDGPNIRVYVDGVLKASYNAATLNQDGGSVTVINPNPETITNIRVYPGGPLWPW